MNAFFRRDYLYTLDTNQLVRYLKYDRKTKEYIFIEGGHKTANELFIRTPKAHVACKRIKVHSWGGYALTNSYLGSNRKDKPRGAKRPSLVRDTFIPTMITNVKDLIEGKKYKVTQIFGSGYLKTDIYTVVRQSKLGLNAKVKSERGGFENIHKDQLERNLIKIELVA